MKKIGRPRKPLHEKSEAHIPIPNPWDKADMENGMLTDKLVSSILIGRGEEHVSGKIRCYKKTPT